MVDEHRDLLCHRVVVEQRTLLLVRSSSMYSYSTPFSWSAHSTRTGMGLVHVPNTFTPFSAIVGGLELTAEQKMEGSRPLIDEERHWRMATLATVMEIWRQRNRRTTPARGGEVRKKDAIISVLPDNFL
jgi:hypothetical protein